MMGHVNFHENFRILNFFEDEINLEEIKDEKIIRGILGWILRIKNFGG